MDNEFQDIFKSQINDESDNDFTETKKEELPTIDPDFETAQNQVYALSGWRIYSGKGELAKKMLEKVLLERSLAVQFVLHNVVVAL